MPFDLLHIVYLLLRFSCCFQKHIIFRCFHQNKISIMRALQRRIFLNFVTLCNFFALFEQIFLRFVRSFLSWSFRQPCHSPFLPAKKSCSFDFFTKRKPYTIKAILSCKCKRLFDVQIFLRLFSHYNNTARINKARKILGFCTRSYFSYQFCPYCGFITPSPFRHKKPAHINAF